MCATWANLALDNLCCRSGVGASFTELRRPFSTSTHCRGHFRAFNSEFTVAPRSVLVRIFPSQHPPFPPPSLPAEITLQTYTRRESLNTDRGRHSRRVNFVTGQFSVTSNNSHCRFVRYRRVWVNIMLPSGERFPFMCCHLSMLCHFPLVCGWKIYGRWSGLWF